MSGTPGGGRDVVAGLHLAWVTERDLPEGDGWLTEAERVVRNRLVVEKRRADWLLGRLAAKRAVGDALGTLESLDTAEILADEDGRPHARVAGVDEPPGLSISHSGGVGFATAAWGGVDVGCDVEVVAPRSAAFVADYFNETERDAVAAAPGELQALLANLIWSAKESALKVLGYGLRADTRVVTVDTAQLSLGAARWTALRVKPASGRVFEGHWRAHDGLVWTVLTSPRTP